jgi:hypothetical protein
MKKNLKKSMRLETETLRSLTLAPSELAKLGQVAGGQASVPCGSHGCTLTGCCPT